MVTVTRTSLNKKITSWTSKRKAPFPVSEAGIKKNRFKCIQIWQNENGILWTDLLQKQIKFHPCPLEIYERPPQTYDQTSTNHFNDALHTMQYQYGLKMNQTTFAFLVTLGAKIQTIERMVICPDILIIMGTSFLSPPSHPFSFTHQSLVLLMKKKKKFRGRGGPGACPPS